MRANEFYTENSKMEIVVATVINDTNSRVKLVEFYQNEQKVRAFRVSSELFKNKLEAKKYFK